MLIVDIKIKSPTMKSDFLLSLYLYKHNYNTYIARSVLCLTTVDLHCLYVLKIVIFLCVVALTYASTPACPAPTPPGPAVACVFVPECQFPENGSLTALAKQCSNELPDSDCEQLFPCDSSATPACDPTGAVPSADADSYPFVRAVACTNPGLHDIAVQCKDINSLII